MKKKLRTKNIIITVLCITIILMGIGFCFVSMSLKEYTSKKCFDVSIRNVIKGTTTKGGTIEPKSYYKLLDNNKTVRFSFNLTNKNDSTNYKIVIKNKGNIDAKIDNIIFSNNDKNSNIEIKNNNLKGEILKPGDEEELNIEISAKQKLKNEEFNLGISVLSSSVK